MQPSYQLVRSRRRSFELRVHPDARVELRAPLRASRADIDAFFQSRSGWLQRTLQRVEATTPVPVWRCEEGAFLALLGESLHLQLRLGKTGVWGEGDALCLSLPQADEARYLALLQGWYRQQAHHIFSRYIEHHFPRFAALGYRRPQLHIKRMKSRWGSLSSRGNLNLNLALLQYAPDCIEYVVVHELCHLAHMNHGAGFKALQAEVLPDWQARKAQLEQQARSLSLPF